MAAPGRRTERDAPSVLSLAAGEAGERIAAAVDRCDVRSVEADTGTDALKRIDGSAPDVVVVPARLPDLAIGSFLDRTSGVDPPIVVGTAPAGHGPSIQLPADASVGTIADRIERALADRLVDAALDRHDRLREALHRLSTTVAGADRDAIEAAVYDALVDADAYEQVWVGRYDADPDRVEFVRPLRRRDPLREADPVVARAIEGGSVATADPAGDPTGKTSAAAPGRAAVPLVDGDSILGVLLLGVPPAAGPDGAERDLLARLGRTVGAAVGRGRGGPGGDDLLGVLEPGVGDAVGLAVRAADLASASPDRLARIGETVETLSTVVEAGRAVAAGRTVEGREPVDVHEVAIEAWQDVPAGGGDAELTIAGPATVEADPTLLDLLVRSALGDLLEDGAGDASVRVGALADGRGFFLTGGGSDGARELGARSADGPGDVVGLVADAHGWTVRVGDGGAGIEVQTTDGRRDAVDELQRLFNGPTEGFEFPERAE